MMQATLELLKHDSYIGAMLEYDTPQLVKALHVFRQTVPDVAEVERNKFDRDGGALYHVTAFRPQEVRALRKQGVDVHSIVDTVDLTLYAIGSITETLNNTANTAYYVLCSSADIDTLRAKYGLPPHDLHVTLGFTVKDIHNQQKDASTILTAL